jgi:outer membrane cobalamin receptor
MPDGWARVCWLLTCFPFLLAAQPPQEPPKAPEPLHTTITVTEKVSAETPANISVLDSTNLTEAPGANLDDRLRTVPGFSLFKRSSSLVAHPTTQGVSLRGIGSSGASRTLLLWDGVPANDPFGGWVYWTQFIPDEMRQVEVSRGAATSIFGDRAMSGAIAVFSTQPQSMHLLADYETGNRDTQDATLGFSTMWRNFAVSGMGRAFTTDGYYIVPAAIRGAVDQTAGVKFVTGDVHLHHYTSFGNFFLKFNLLDEERKNGTTLTRNSTSMGTVSLHYEREFGHNAVSILGFHTGEGFHSSFSSVSADRNTERLTYLQSAPSDATGGAAMWQHHQRKWNLLAGADVDRVQGTSTDHLVPTGLREGGGIQLQHGVFAQADALLGPVRLFGGLRHSVAGEGSNFLSPSAGLSVARKSLRLRGSVYRAFRAATLNELFREFRVGNTDTLPNASLRPETVFGAEAGVDWVGENSAFRVTAFRNSLDNLITNVTLSSAPNLIVRQRENAAAALSRGVEAGFQHRYRNWTGEIGYLYADSRYVTGYRISQIPRNQATAQVSYVRGGTVASAGLRAYDYQFDDDLNQFRLPGYAVLQFMVMQHIVKALTAEASLENALDRTFYTAFTPTPNIGAPRLWRVGLRWSGHLR